MIDNTLYIFAARYAHHRNTGAAYQVVRCILEAWDRLDQQTRLQLVREASEATTCKEDWDLLLNKGHEVGL